MNDFQSHITKIYYSTGEIDYDQDDIKNWMEEFSIDKKEVLSIIRKTKKQLKGFFNENKSSI